MTAKYRIRSVNVCIPGSKMTFFRSLETLKGTFIRRHMRQSCLGYILEVFLSGMEAGNVNND